MAALLSVYLVAPSTRAQELPVQTTDDLWDISQGTMIISNSNLNWDYAPENLFGEISNPGSYQEEGNVVFKDGLSPNTVHHIEWQTAEPVSLERFRLFAWHDQSRLSGSSCSFANARVRGFNTFRLLAKNSSGEFELLEELEPIVDHYYRIMNEEYKGTAPNDVPNNGLTFLYEGTLGSPIVAQEFRAEFIQHGDPEDPDPQLCSYHRGRTGPRVVELDGFGEVAPPDPKREPVIIVPGLAASHNSECILRDRCAAGVGTWKFTPTVDWYYPLIERLESEGYEQGRDLFIAFYDWRQSNIESAVEYLVPTIDEALAASGATKVDIVAHSMGGHVARAYAQSGPQYRNDIDQLITLGTPHEGAADAYTVWESGDFPTRWKFGARQWIRRIDRSLNKERSTALEPPLSFRSFFPSLAELVPTNEFVTREGTPLASDDLKLGRNLFLEALQDTVERLQGIDVTAIAGNSHTRLDKVPIEHNRTQEDLALGRWRDGHALPDPPEPDSNSGDQTVLTTSALAVGGIKQTVEALHEELPGIGQETVVDVLLADAQEQPRGDFIPVNLASSGLGVDILSPIIPTITGPNGEVLSATENTFTNATFDWDPEEESGTKMLTILDPPAGEYSIAYEGTDTGEYTVITTYADEESTVITERSGTATVGQKEVSSIVISEDEFLVSPKDIQSIANQIRETVESLKGGRHMRPKQLLQLYITSGQLKRRASVYVRLSEKHGLANKRSQKALKALKQVAGRFERQVERVTERNNVDEERFSLLVKHVQDLKNSGLLKK